MSTTINNFGTYVCGDVIVDSVVGNCVVRNDTLQKVTIDDSEIIRELRAAAALIDPKNKDERDKIRDLQEELSSERPRVGKLQAIYDWLRRNCKAETVLSAIKVFGELLIKAMG